MTSAKPPSADPSSSALAWLVGDVDAFRASWGTTPFVRRAEPGFEALASIPLIETWLARSGRRPMFRMVQDGVTLPASDITRTARLGGQDVSDLADVDRIAQRFRDGATLVVQNIEHALPAVQDLVVALTAELSHPVQANGYVTPPGATGLASHADTHDVLVLQVSGTKHWEVDGIGELTTVPGDVVYIPTGTRHAAHTSNDASLHLTLGILRVTTRQLIRRMLESLDGDLEEPLPVCFATGSSETLAAEVSRRLERVIAGLRSLDPLRVADMEIERIKRRAKAGRTDALSAVVAESAVDQDTVVRPRVPLGDDVLELTDDRVYVRLADRSIGLPRAAEPAVRQLLTAPETSVSDLTGIDASSRVVVVRRLIREGVLEILSGAGTMSCQ